MFGWLKAFDRFLGSGMDLKKEFESSVMLREDTPSYDDYLTDMRAKNRSVGFPTQARKPDLFSDQRNLFDNGKDLEPIEYIYVHHPIPPPHIG